MELLGDRWTYPVLRELMLAPKRFTELETTVRGITPAVLSARLKALETSGPVQKITLPPPARVAAYELTAWSRQLRPIFEELGRWAQALAHLAHGGLWPHARRHRAINADDGAPEPAYPARRSRPAAAR